MLPLDPTDLVTGATLIVHPSELLNALIAVFEILWQLALPIAQGGGDSRLNDRERVIPTLMSSGATDEAIARRLGCRDGPWCGTRWRCWTGWALRDGSVQAGVQAARLGWL